MAGDFIPSQPPPIQSHFFILSVHIVIRVRRSFQSHGERLALPQRAPVTVVINCESYEHELKTVIGEEITGRIVIAVVVKLIVKPLVIPSVYSVVV